MLVPLLWVLYLPVRKPRAAEVASWSWSGCVLFTEAQCRQVLSEQAERAASATPRLGSAGHPEEAGDMGQWEVKVCALALLVLLLTRQGFSWGEGRNLLCFLYLIWLCPREKTHSVSILFVKRAFSYSKLLAWKNWEDVISDRSKV